MNLLNVRFDQPHFGLIEPTKPQTKPESQPSTFEMNFKAAVEQADDLSTGWNPHAIGAVSVPLDEFGVYIV